MTISIHKALTGLDRNQSDTAISIIDFNPQGPHGPRRPNVIDSADIEPISIHKALTGLDALAPLGYTVYAISIHKALTGLDFFHVSLDSMYANFNPQGPHGPRLPIS